MHKGLRNAPDQRRGFWRCRNLPTLYTGNEWRVARKKLRNGVFLLAAITRAVRIYGCVLFCRSFRTEQNYCLQPSSYTNNQLRPHTTEPLQPRKVKSFPRKCQISKCSEKKKSLKLVPLQPRNCALRWEKAWLQDPLHTLLPLATPPQVAITSRGDCAHLLSPAKATLHSMLSKIVPST